MDSVVVEALRHLSGHLDDPVEFFQAVDADYQEHKDAGFDAFRSAFAARRFGVSGEELIKYLDDNGRFELVAKIVEQRPEELAAEYQAAADDGPESDQDSPETAAAWQAMLTEYREYWDGDEANWAAFEQYVLYYATERGLAGPARQFFDRAATEDKLTLFAEYGVEPPSGSAADEGDGTDPQDALWQAAIEQFGPSWAAWDGTDTGWAEYRDWFYNATNSQDPDMYALAYERLSPLDDLAPDERVAHLRDFGFDVSGVGTETPEQRIADFQALADDPSVEGIDRETLDQLLQDPEFDQRVAAAEAELDAELEAALAD